MAEEQVQVEKEKKSKVKIKKTKVYHGTGKRKTSIAKATLTPEGKGVVRVNSVSVNSFEPLFARERLLEPLFLAEDVVKGVDIKVTVNGGGWSGQTEAARLAIARALAAYDKKLKKTFSSYDKFLLVADTRFKEERKPNDSKARAMRQSSKR